jgi:hypothetical protein
MFGFKKKKPIQEVPLAVESRMKWGMDGPVEHEPEIKVQAWKHNLGGDALNRDDLYFFQKKFSEDNEKKEQEGFRLTLFIQLRSKEDIPVHHIYKPDPDQYTYKSLIKAHRDAQDFEEMEGIDDGDPKFKSVSNWSPAMFSYWNFLSWYFWDQEIPSYTIIYWGEGDIPDSRVVFRDEIVGFRTETKNLED